MMQWGQPMIRFENVSKVYNGNTPAVENLNLEIERGEFVCLIGPSGCGKTTTMKMINRLIEPTSGTIKINGKDIMQIDAVDLRRGIGYVIQQIGLFPHMTVAENVALVPKLLGWNPERRRKRVGELLPLVGLDPAEFRDRYPRELSGGQQQRVGIIRAMAAKPDVILMDEPFSALDPISRESLQDEVKRLQRKLKLTIVFVTHDIDEALKLGDRIAMMRAGQIVQLASPEELLRNPKDEFVAQFIGRDRLLTDPDVLTVADVMIKPVTVDPGHGLAEAIVTMKKRRVNSLLVTDENDKLLGIVLPKQIDLTRRGTVADVMRTDVVTTAPDAHLREAFQRMFLDHLDLLPVVTAEGILVGLLTSTAMVDALSDVIWAEGDGQ
jgi:osmoprotectant transport system ATP-binding protein